MISRTSWKPWALAAVCLAALFVLYLVGLTRTGLLGPDEPRYAAVGRAMAESGDWITPRLWGQPWFEKPPLLYWMTAAAFKAGLGPDLAPRLPVALVSVVFLVCFFAVLRREFGAAAAFYATAILGTSAGWLAYSHVAVTDLPMSAAFAAAMLLTLKKPLPNQRNPAPAWIAGALLGLAVLAKGLVPLALSLPLLWYWRGRFRDLLRLFAAMAVVALPWYIAVTVRNGAPFLEEFFWKQHFERFATPALQHVQPLGYYVPVLIAGLFPWSPLLLLLFQERTLERRTWFLLAWLAWGLLFFSISRNKLPGYLLPLMPAAAALLGIAVAQTRAASSKMAVLLFAAAALLSLIPAVLNVLPQALLVGFSHSHVSLSWSWIPVAAIAALGCVLFEKSGQRVWAFALTGALVAACVFQTVWQVYPQLDHTLSGRGTPLESVRCVEASNRSRRYGIQYYAGRTLPDCN